MSQPAVDAPKAVMAPNKRKPAAKKAASHPPTSQMVNAAIAGLHERGGSSLQAIKKYIAANYKVDMVRMAPHIRRYITKASGDGRIVRRKGSFQLDAKKAAPKKRKAKKAKKPKKTKSKKAKKSRKARKPKKKAAKKPKAKKAKKTKRAAKPKKAKRSKSKKK